MNWDLYSALFDQGGLMMYPIVLCSVMALRRCCADERHRRPTPKQLVHAFKRLNGLRPGKSKARRRWQRAVSSALAARDPRNAELVK